MSERTPEFQYVLEDGESFREQVAAGDPNPLTGIKIVVDGVDLTGAPAEEDVYYVDDYVYYNLRKILGALPAVQDGERRELQFYSVPDALVLDPVADGVQVGFGDVSGEADDSGPTLHTVPEDVLVEEFVDTASTFVDRCEAINPDLSESDELQTLRELI